MLRKNFTVNRYYSKTEASYVLKLKTDGKPECVSLEKLEYVVHALGEYPP